jgi:hypothetical protein
MWPPSHCFVYADAPTTWYAPSWWLPTSWRLPSTTWHATTTLAALMYWLLGIQRQAGEGLSSLLIVHPDQQARCHVGWTHNARMFRLYCCSWLMVTF